MKRIMPLLALVALVLPALAHAEPSQWGIKHVGVPVGETIVGGPERGTANLNVAIRRVGAKEIRMHCNVAARLGMTNDGVHGLVEWQEFAPACEPKKEAMCPLAAMQVTLGEGVLQASALYRTSFILETPAQFEVSCAGELIPPFEGTMIMYPGDFDCVGNPAERIDDVDHDLKWKREAPPLTNVDGSTLSFSQGGFGFVGAGGELVAAYFNGEPNDCPGHHGEPAAASLRRGTHPLDGPGDGDDDDG